MHRHTTGRHSARAVVAPIKGVCQRVPIRVDRAGCNANGKAVTRGFDKQIEDRVLIGEAPER